ncbi:uncharacterized protein DUF1934 [Ruminococcaceae bacterium R-25]|nr:uncharacterized protein DUF1934 [Ruminococcaceae bacterium R-25]SUQ11794.1 protein of unknown function [Oscillospiraceae bacterium]
MESVNEEKCLFVIRSGMYGDPLTTKGTKTVEGSRTIYDWTEKHSEQEKETHFVMTLIKEESKAIVVRNGDVTSRMVFETGKKTTSTMNTTFGPIEVVIDTDYINFPGGLIDGAEISYTLDPDSGEPIRNLFSIKRLLQNEEI